MTPDRGTARLFIIDFDLKRLSGHFFNQVYGFREAARARAMEPRIFLPQTANAKVVAALDAQAMLPDVIWHGPDRDLLLESMPAAHRALSPLWDALEAERVSARDILVVTSSRPPVVHGLGLWLDTLRPEARPAVFLRFFAQDFLNFQTMDFNKHAWAHRFASRELALRRSTDRVFFTINDRSRLADLERLSLRRAFFMPAPKYYGDPADARAGGPSDLTTIYVHANRGGPLPGRINDVARAILKDRSDVRFLVRFCKHADGSVTAHRSIDASLIGAGVDLLPTEDELAEYLVAIARAQIVLLPYDPIEYRAIVSGAFCEAVALGKVVVAPGGTWMAEQIAQGRAAGVLFKDPAADDIAEAIARAMRDMPRLQPEATRCAETFRSENSCLGNLDLMLTLAGEVHDMRLSYLPRTRFAEVSGSRRCLGDGWSATETGSGVWTDDVTADMVFRLKPGAQPLTLVAELKPFIAEPHPELRVEVIINERWLGEWFFSITHPADLDYTKREVTIPADIVASGTLNVTLRLDRPASPRELGLSDDPRRLGVMLHALSLTPAGDR